jgi:Ca-activated chloride channel homolog
MFRVLGTLFAFATLAPGQIQPPRVTFRSDATLVRVDAQVFVGGRAITGLNRDDFAVFEDGRPQPILHFGNENDPLDLLLLIDKSGSMQPVTAEIVVSAVGTLALLGSRDRVGVMLFDSERALLAAPMSGKEEVASRLEGFLREENIVGATDINGAVLEAALFMRRLPRTDARRSILILTDNRSAKLKRDRTVIRELWEADAVLNALVFQSGMDQVVTTYRKVTNPWGILLTADVTKIVKQTGGESMLAGKPVASLREMLERIRRRYSLHYRAPAGPAGKQRSIRVALSADAMKRYPGATVRARRGYIPLEVVP